MGTSFPELAHKAEGMAMCERRTLNSTAAEVITAGVPNMGAECWNRLTKE